jgi:hypothetical protein
VDDPLTVAHLRALSWIHRHHAALAEKRRAVQARRLRADAEIFAKFRPAGAVRATAVRPDSSRPLLPELSKATLEEILTRASVSFSVVIPTYRRPERLPVLDASRSRRSAEFEVAVDDSSGTLTARPAPPYRSVSSAGGGLLARNRGVRGRAADRDSWAATRSGALLAVHGRATPAAASDRRARLHHVAADLRVSPFLHQISGYGLQFATD